MSNAPVSTTVRSLRVLRGLGIRELARLAECSDGTIRRIESGDSDPSVGLLRTLLEVLDADDQTRLALLSPSS